MKKIKEYFNHYRSDFNLKSALLLSLVVFIVSFVWIVIGLPSISVSTSELKSRNLFIDEHAIVTNSKVIVNTPYLQFDTLPSSKRSLIEDISISEESIIDQLYRFSCVKSGFYHLFIKCEKVQPILNSVNPYLEVQIHSPYSPKSLERIVLVILWPLSFPSSFQKDLLTLLYNVFQTLSSSKWNHKQLTFIFAAVNSSEEVLKEFELRYFDNSYNLDNSIVREAYNFDFTFFNTFCTKNDNLDTNQKEFILGWDELWLEYMGDKGLLPNLDLLSISRHLFPRFIQLEYSYDIEVLNDRNQTIPIITRPNHFLKKCEDFIPQSFSQIVTDWTSPRPSKVPITPYSMKLCTMLSNFRHSFLRSVGLHDMWLQHNVDSITLRAMLGTNRKKNYNMKEIFYVLLSYVYISNHLHGK